FQDEAVLRALRPADLPVESPELLPDSALSPPKEGGMVSKKACWDRCRLAEIVEGDVMQGMVEASKTLARVAQLEGNLVQDKVFPINLISQISLGGQVLRFLKSRAPVDVEVNILRTELLKREAKEEVLRGLEVVVVMEVAIMVLEGTIVVSRQW
ncbi:unnamed protein product, partial [Durusdinium trenchii]